MALKLSLWIAYNKSFILIYNLYTFALVQYLTFFRDFWPWVTLIDLETRLRIIIWPRMTRESRAEIRNFTLCARKVAGFPYRWIYPLIIVSLKYWRQNLPRRSASWCAGVTIAKVDSFRNKSIKIRRRDDLRGVIDWKVGPWEIIRIYNNNVWARCIVLLRFSIKPITRSEFLKNHIIINKL